MDNLSERFIEANINTGEPILSGYPQLDSIIGGFRRGNTYLCGGLEKSGKSAFLMGMVNHLLDANHLVYIDTELTNKDFTNRMTAIAYGDSIDSIETENKQRFADGSFTESKSYKWIKKYEAHLTYLNFENDLIKKDNNLSIGGVIKVTTQFEDTDVLIIDNLTSFSTTNDKREQWQKLSSALSAIINFTKQRQLVTFVVIHTKPGVVWTETAQGVRSILKDNAPEKIFDESITINRRPSIADIYGGGAGNSQLSGSILIWRPFQKFQEENLQKMSLIIVESFRHAKNGEVRAEFHGNKMRFEEIKQDGFVASIKESIF